ncbi:hypothetical protein MKX01_003886 [Papaver californicum]|nr:hypothetical protein MKX01_003886 [Papaver californicum]
MGFRYNIILAVATIWIDASFVVQSVVDSGVSPFLITYICNSLFVVYIPIFEISRYFEDSVVNFRFWGRRSNKNDVEILWESEQVVLLGETSSSKQSESIGNPENLGGHRQGPGIPNVFEIDNQQLDEKRRWTRSRMARVSLLICPFWFLAQLTFTSSLFTFLVALLFLGEKFTWVKLISVLLCMTGTIIVSLGDSQPSSSCSSGFYAVYITLIRKQLPDEDDDKSGRASMAQFLGYLGLFNLLLFLPISLLLNFTKLEPFHALSWQQFGLIVRKGLLDNVLSDYLWAKAVLLATTTVATAGLMIQVPLAAIVDSMTGNAPHLLDYI